MIARLFNLVYAVALCGMLAGVFACGACFLGVLWPMTREAVTTRIFVLMTLWGTVFLFALALLPAYL